MRETLIARARENKGKIKSYCGVFATLVPRSATHYVRLPEESVSTSSSLSPRVPEPHTWPLGHCSAYNEVSIYTLHVRLSAHMYMAGALSL